MQTLACSPQQCEPQLAHAQKAASSPQYGDGKFKNPGPSLDMGFGEYASTTWEWLFQSNERTPEGTLPRKPVDLAYFSDPGPNQLNVTWLGHSTLLINLDGFQILTDPVFEKSVTMVGPTRFDGEVPLAVSQLPPIDAVVISHDHYDHLNKASILALVPRTRRFVMPLGVGSRLAGWGVPDEKIMEFDWWESFFPDGKFTFTATPSQHFSGRGLFDRDKTLWTSWVMEGPSHKVFFSGDSGYFDGFKQIGRAFGPFDMTFLECGAYNQAWRPVHMFPEETVQAHRDLGGKILHPIHWATFNLSLHSWYEPMERLTQAAEIADVDAVTPVVGDTTVLGTTHATAKWWRPLMKKKAS